MQRSKIVNNARAWVPVTFEGIRSSGKNKQGYVRVVGDRGPRFLCTEHCPAYKYFKSMDEYKLVNKGADILKDGAK